MDIEGRRQSTNIEDRRGSRAVRTGAGLSLGGVLFLVVLSLLGINPLPFLGMATKAPEVQMQQPDQPYQENASGAARLTAVVLADTETAWSESRRATRSTFRPRSCCSPMRRSRAAVTPVREGPFYCPVNQKVHRPELLRPARTSPARTATSHRRT
jgi:predicted metalloprotease